MNPTSRVKIHCQVNHPFSRKVKRAGLRQAVHAALDSAAEQRAGALTLLITDDAHIKELNLAYRGIDTPTDVLSFGSAEAGSGFVSSPSTEIYWGDIVISYPRAFEQASTFGHPATEEVWLLIIHGVLHLLGYDHEQIEDQEQMWSVQRAALANLGIQWQP
jgi:probable rRNA maturation factor